MSLKEEILKRYNINILIHLEGIKEEYNNALNIVIRELKRIGLDGSHNIKVKLNCTNPVLSKIENYLYNEGFKVIVKHSESYINWYELSISLF